MKKYLVRSEGCANIPTSYGVTLGWTKSVLSPSACMKSWICVVHPMDIGRLTGNILVGFLFLSYLDGLLSDLLSKRVLAFC
jgi:hypothetical protein